MNDYEQESQALIPIEQQTITFRNHALVVVRLPDGRPGVVLRWICENLHIDPAAQVARIKRLEGLEAITGLIPEILERLGPEKLTDKHQSMVKHYVEQLMKTTGKPWGTIYSSLYAAFSVSRYQEIPEAEWDKVEHWFKGQIERARKK